MIIQVETPLGRIIPLSITSDDLGEGLVVALERFLQKAGITSSLTPDYQWALLAGGNDDDNTNATRLRLTCYKKPYKECLYPLISVFPRYVEAYNLSVNWVGSAKLNGNEGWVALGWNDIETIVNHITHGEEKAEDMTIVDLGSGTGSAMIGFGAHGFGRVIGIELDDKLCNCCREIIQMVQNSSSRNNQFEVIRGSYYTRDMVFDNNTSGFHVKKCEECMLHLVQNTSDIDLVVQKAISSANAVTAFLWSVQIASVMELFVRHARDNAMLVIANSNKRINHPDLQPTAEFHSNAYHASESSPSSWHLRTSGYPITFYRKKHSGRNAKYDS